MHLETVQLAVRADRPEDQHTRFRHSRRAEPSQSSAIAFDRGARNGRLMVSTPSPLKISSKPALNSSPDLEAGTWPSARPAASRAGSGLAHNALVAPA